MSARTPGQAMHDALRESAVIEFDLDIESFEKWEHVRPSQRNRLEAAAQAVLKVGVCPHGDLAAQLDQLRDRLATLAASLDADALATEPSKKSQIQADAARRDRKSVV